MVSLELELWHLFAQRKMDRCTIHVFESTQQAHCYINQNNKPKLYLVNNHDQKTIFRKTNKSAQSELDWTTHSTRCRVHSYQYCGHHLSGSMSPITQNIEFCFFDKTCRILLQNYLHTLNTRFVMFFDLLRWCITSQIALVPRQKIFSCTIFFFFFCKRKKFFVLVLVDRPMLDLRSDTSC